MTDDEPLRLWFEPGRCPECDEPDGKHLRWCSQRPYDQEEVTGKFYGANPTESERESGEAVEREDKGPLKKGSAGHLVLIVFGEAGEPLTAYEASMRAAGDYHSRRREATRLLARGFLEKCGHLPNPAPKGRPRVDAYQITDAGRSDLVRLG